jgi:hypothetical protein
MAAEPVNVVLRDKVAEVVRREALRTGRTESEVVELAIHRLVAPSILDRLWDRATLTEDAASTIAIDEVQLHRDERRAG